MLSVEDSAFISPLLTRFLVPWQEKHPHNMIILPPCLTVGTVFWVCWTFPLFLHAYSASMWPNNSKLVSSDHKTVVQMFLSCCIWSLASAMRAGDLPEAVYSKITTSGQLTCSLTKPSWSCFATWMLNTHGGRKKKPKVLRTRCQPSSPVVETSCYGNASLAKAR